ncbi:hypothetical protein J1N35_031719 [Gossypium stocksii]|uniref:CCHC-type domain-containing protein n=1 Tax=Gossypium stocksii TaxID=47602 RepID=A0A9D3V347_9ROSI|nr:hypothetical protein J1N35_031719 [Gossypium stocksii]
MAGEEISLLADELIQLTMKSSLVTPRSRFSLLCSLWTRKTYNPDEFCAQLISIWKTKRKFEIYMAGQNLFQLLFEDKNDLELIMDGKPWLFWKQLIIFDRITKATERSKLKLVFSPFWLRIGSHLLECEKKDLMHVIGSMFRDIKGEICRLKILLDARKPLRRGIFIVVGNTRKAWLPFKYESLPNFYFSCGIMGHIAKDCNGITKQVKNIGDNDLPYSIALKAESNLKGRESLQLGKTEKKFMEQCLYTGEEEDRITSMVTLLKDNDARAKAGTMNKIHAKSPNRKINEEIKKKDTQQEIECGDNATDYFLTEFVSREEFVNRGKKST